MLIRLQYILWLFLLLQTLIRSGTSRADEVPQPRVVSGLLDLSSISWDDHTIMTLKGDYLYLPGLWLDPTELLLQPEKLKDAKLYSIPENILENPRSAEKKGLNTRKGTLVLRLQGLPVGQSLAFLTPRVSKASHIFLFDDFTKNPQPIHRAGTLALDPGQIVPMIRSQLVAFTPAKSEGWLVIQASSINEPLDDSPIFFESPQLSKFSVLHESDSKRHFTQFFILGMFILICVFNLALFVQRPEDRGSGFLALMALFFALRYVATEDLISHIFTQPSWWIYEMTEKFRTCAFDIACVAYGSFNRFSYSSYSYRRVQEWAWIYVTLRVAFVLATPAAFFGQYTLLFFYPLIPYFIYQVSIPMRAALAREEGALLSFVGFLVGGLAQLNDLLVFTEVWQGPYLAHWGVVVFILFQSLVTGKRFAQAFRATVRLSRELHKKNEELKDKDRARTQFLHNTSHELRTPLNGILGFVDLLRKGNYGPQTEVAYQQLNKVYGLADGLKQQVNTILDLARSKRGDLQVRASLIPLNKVAEEILILGEGLRGEDPSIEFTLKVSWDKQVDPKFASDQEKLLTILRNLVGNAFKFRKLGKKHSVILELILEENPYQLTLRIRDTGIGIDKKDLDLVFKEFGQVDGGTSRAYEGTGLGLAMVKAYVESLGGTIAVDSEPLAGSTFTVKLPSIEGQQLDAGPLHNASVASHEAGMDDLSSFEVPEAKLVKQLYGNGLADTASGRSSNLLLVDDRPLNLEVLAEILFSHGYACRTASGGREALQMMREEAPDLIILDLMMPEVSGEDVLKTMRSDPLLSGIPVILLTARASQEDRILGLELGADDYLAKPFIPAEVLVRVRNILSRVNITKQQSKIESSLEAARMVQQAFLPAVVEYPGLQIATYYQSADQTGGDWFYYYVNQKSQLLFALIGDVTGHGIPSAMLTGTTTGAVRSLFAGWDGSQEWLNEDQSLRQLVHVVNRTIFETGTRTQHLMSMAFVCLNLQTGRLVFFNAGHPHLYIRSGEQVQSLVAFGSPLGLYPTFQGEPQERILHRGDILFLFTDGLLENQGPDGKHLRTRELERMLSSSKTVGTLKDKLNDRCQELWKDHSLDDDVSYLVFQWSPEKKSEAALG